jgi:HK97 gp10 family phage protein
MAKTTVQIEGLADLKRRLEALPKEVGAKGGGPARAALFRGAKVIRDQAIANAPRETGFLISQIAALRSRNPRIYGATEMYSVGVKLGKARRYANTKRNRGKQRVGKTYNVEGNAFYWRFIEFGTEKRGATPFLRPAFESRKEDALDTIVRELGAGIDRAVRKLGAR